MEKAMSVEEKLFLWEFSEKAAAAEEKGRRARDCARQCAHGLGEVQPDALAEAEKRSGALEKAFAAYQERLSTPVLRIAVFGTTSSAKSTLLNFLIGENLLPTDVGEKSAGTVRIIHAPAMKLEIEDTPGRIWECGEFAPENAQEIRSTLEAVMDAYRNAVENGEEMDAPSFIVAYPTSVPALLNLPDAAAVELMDLPGLKFTGDSRNRAEIARCREALCLVTFGSQETDPLKQDALLDDAVAQVQAIGSPVGRMLFVATRVDEFFLRSPENWPDNEQQFMESRLKAVREKMAAAFPEQDTASLNLTSISPLPAFYAQQLFLPQTRGEAWKKIRHSFLGLVEGGRNGDPNLGIDLEVDLRPSSRLWEEDDWEMIISQLEETTRAGEFVLALKDHIQKNFASIVMPAAGAAFVEESKAVHEWLAGELAFARNTLARNFEEQRERLEGAVKTLREINARSTRRLEDFLQAWLAIVFDPSEDDEEKRLTDLAERYPGFMGAKLACLHGWKGKIRQAYLEPFRAVVDRLSKGRPLPQNLPERMTLEKICTSLHKNGYSGQTAIAGVTASSTEADREKKFSEMVTAYNNLGDACAKSAQKSLQEAVLFHTDKILEALTELQDSWLAWLDREYAGYIPAEFSEVAKVTPGSLRKFAEKAAPDKPVRLGGRRAEHTRENVSTVRETRAKANTGIPLLDAVVETWWGLLGKGTVRRAVQVVQNRFSIPPVHTLRLEAKKTAQAREKEMSRHMRGFAEGQMDLFLENIAGYQAMRIDSYRKRLDDVIRREVDVKKGNEARLKELDGLLNEMAAAVETIKNF